MDREHSVQVEPEELICFAYQHEYRLVLVAEIRFTKDGNELITGLDEDRNEMRSFRVDRIQRGKIRKVK